LAFGIPAIALRRRSARATGEPRRMRAGLWERRRGRSVRVWISLEPIEEEPGVAPIWVRVRPGPGLSALREPGSEVAVRGSPRAPAAPAGLDRLVLDRPPAALAAVFTGTPIAADLSLDAAAPTRRDPDEGLRVLRRYRYVAGFRRDWSSADGRILTAFSFAF